MSAIISNIIKNSPACKAKIKAGLKLMSINSNKINDIIDYMYYSTGEKLALELTDDEKIIKYNIRKEEYEDLGLQFDDYLMDKEKHCSNKCIFCFIDQLPRGMRDTLYYKDDDLRMSFLVGNYISLTNLSGDDIERVIKQKISPINISVHTMNSELRVKMMGSPKAAKINEIMSAFAKAGLQMRCQLVICKGINDGKELEYSLNELYKLYPAVTSVSVVPVGLTKHRQNLFDLEPLNKLDAQEIIDITENFSKTCLNKDNTRFCYPADELFIKAGREIPDYDYYEEFEQLENGVGLISLLQHDFNENLLKQRGGEKHLDLSIATGVSAAPYINSLIDETRKKWHNLNCKVYAVKNAFFGETVNVSGLITGKDLTEQLKNKDLGSCLLIPSVMLRHEKDMFLDSMTIKKAEEILNVTIKPVSINGRDFLNALIGGKV